MYELEQKGWTVTAFNNGMALQATKGKERVTASSIENLEEIIEEKFKVIKSL